MSLSQKHFGKILVPWFNTEEWRLVYSYVYSGDKEEQRKALEILKIWKIRTPLLSAGVEGTLILLEAIANSNEGSLDDEKISQIYSLALVRFLNICAANNEKQGTFYKTATEHDLPKWLINIRHDIAHGHRLPSNNLLEASIRQCLEWLRQKYWIPQSEIISDCFIEEESEDKILTNLLDIYISFTVSMTKGTSFKNTKAEIKKLNDLIFKRYRRVCKDQKEISTLLEEMLTEYFKTEKNKNIGKSVSKILASEKALLRDLYEEHSQQKRILDQNIVMWEKVLNIFHESGYLFDLIGQLYEITSDILKQDDIKLTASLWIYEIISSLNALKIKKNKNQENLQNSPADLEENPKENGHMEEPEVYSRLTFKNTDFLYLEEAQEFETRVLENPNEYSMSFLELLFKYNNRDSDWIKTTLKTMNLITGNNPINDTVVSEICTIESLDLNDDESMDVRQNVEDSEQQNSSSSLRWQRVTDTSIFKGCPLGVLAHQPRSENPLLCLI